jgi:hypothetical protein
MPPFTCLCGAVRVALARRPDYVNACNCTLCRKTGARWAYLSPAEVAVEGATRGFTRADKPEPAADVRFCPTCGAATHFVLTAAAAARFGNTLAGVNMALADPDELAGVELRYPDGRGWSGEGAFAYRRPARVLGAGD